MTLNLSQEEISNAILSALCNGALSDLYSSGVGLNYEQAIYKAHKQEGDCYEDVLMRMINAGQPVELIDLEDDDAVLGQITLEKATAFINSTEDEHAQQVIQQLVNEEDDSETGYCFLQFIVFGEIIYG